VEDLFLLEAERRWEGEEEREEEEKERLMRRSIKVA
jgi:hypothetical protein